MENTRGYQQIKVSKEAYFRIKELAKKDKYRARGMVGVVDDIVLGAFTTVGSGNYKDDCGGNYKKSLD